MNCSKQLPCFIYPSISCLTTKRTVHLPRKTHDHGTFIRPPRTYLADPFGLTTLTDTQPNYFMRMMWVVYLIPLVRPKKYWIVWGDQQTYGMRFACSKCNVLLQDWMGANPILTIGGQHLEIANEFTYLGSCLSCDGSVTKEISMRISEVRLAFANLKHFCRRTDISLAVEGRV
jgi:hypothetical protein